MSGVCGVRFLWGGRAAGNPFEAFQRGAGKRYNGPIAPDGEPETAGRKPISHEHRADDADQRARDHVAGMMRQEHQATDRNRTAYTIMMALACDQTAETAKASAKLVTAWPDGSWRRLRCR